MKSIIQFILISGIHLLAAQSTDLIRTISKENMDLAKLQSFRRNTKQSVLHGFSQVNTSTMNESKISRVEESGYILLMEATFAGLGYLSSRENKYGPLTAGGFDLFMGSLGLMTATSRKMDAVTIGFYLLTAGYFAKSFYNLNKPMERDPNQRFWVNFTGYNLLVFSGYCLDSLN